MSISYEEALSTLQAMFGEPWTQDNLDTVLRHYQGHMENTVEALLAHGQQDPQLLLEKLKSGSESRTSNTSLDEELARQLSSQLDESAAPVLNGTGGGGEGGVTPPAAGTVTYLENYTPRGKPTTLPDDFLRVKTTTSQSTLDSDEQLAKMLQDQWFSEELRRNPDFAHLAGRPRMSSAQHQTGRSSFAARNTAQQQQPMPLPNIMEKLSEMGNSAKFKLAQMAEQFKNNTNRLAANVGGATPGAVAHGSSPDRKYEMKGLLSRGDDYDDGLASRKDL